MLFGDCSVDLDARRLSRGSAPVHLSPKAFDALKMLIERRPGAVSKAELLERVWRGVFVSDGSLTRAINEIRAAVGDVAREGQIIRTVHSYGYAFVADVREEEGARVSAASPHMASYFVSATRTVALRQGDQVIGRDPTSDIRIDSPKVSWRHAKITASGTVVLIEDLASKNGTYVRGIRIDSATRLGDGDEVRIGRAKFAFRIEAQPQGTETDADSSTSTTKSAV